MDTEDPPPNLSAAAAAARALATKRKLALALRGQGRLREAALAEAVAEVLKTLTASSTKMCDVPSSLSQETFSAGISQETESRVRPRSSVAILEERLQISVFWPRFWRRP